MSEKRCSCGCGYKIRQESPVEPVETIEESKGCKHTEIITASRNAVVMVRAGLSDIGIVIMPMSRENNEISKQENAYDSLLANIEEVGCYSCKYLDTDPTRESNFLQFVTEYVENYIK